MNYLLVNMLLILVESLVTQDSLIYRRCQQLKNMSQQWSTDDSHLMVALYKLHMNYTSSSQAANFPNNKKLTLWPKNVH